MVRGIIRAYGPDIRALAIDTDAQAGGSGDIPFLLLGGNRLAGRGTGGQPTSARAAFQDTPTILDTSLDGVRTVVIVTALGGGTGSGATGEILKHLHTLGIATLVFATLPFAFEGGASAPPARRSAPSSSMPTSPCSFPSPSSSPPRNRTTCAPRSHTASTRSPSA